MLDSKMILNIAFNDLENKMNGFNREDLPIEINYLEIAEGESPFFSVMEKMANGNVLGARFN